jgi:two-component system sensor histidine kinase DesK
VTNVVRHSQATRARISIGTDGADAVLEVTDDGRGGSAPDGSGLTGMRERVAAVGGEVVRIGGDGTRLQVRVPVS